LASFLNSQSTPTTTLLGLVYGTLNKASQGNLVSKGLQCRISMQLNYVPIFLQVLKVPQETFLI